MDKLGGISEKKITRSHSRSKKKLGVERGKKEGMDRIMDMPRVKSGSEKPTRKRGGTLEKTAEVYIERKFRQRQRKHGAG